MASLAIAAATALGASASTAATIGTVVTVASAALTIGTTIYQALNQPKQRFEGPRLGDLSIQSSTRGSAIPRVWGSMRVSGNVIDGKKYEERQEVEVGGKMFGGGSSTQVSYVYKADLAVSLCEGPISGIRRIWLNNKLWWTAADDASDAELEASEEREDIFTVYLGTDSQDPDPILEALHGAGNVPAYRHTAYIVFDKLELKDFGNVIPNVSVEVCNTPEELGAPSEIPPAPSGGLYYTNMVRDPDTGRFFRHEFDNGVLQVYDTTMDTLLAEIALPDATANNPASTPCYVPTTREIWVPYDIVNGAPYYWSGIAIIDPDALVVKETFAVNMVGIGPAFYNPARDEVLVHDQWNAGAFFIYNPHDHSMTVGNDDPTLIYQQEYISRHNVILTAGADENTFWLLDADDYSVVATITNSGWPNSLSLPCVSYDANRDVVYFAHPEETDLYTVDLSPLDVGGAPVLGTARTLPYDPRRGLVFSKRKDKLYLQTIVAGDDLFSLDPDTLDVVDSYDLSGLSSGNYLTVLDNSRYLIGGDRWKLPLRQLFSNDGVLLSEIVTDICEEADLPGASLDVAALTDVVFGYVRAQPMEATAAIAPLMTTYHFLSRETDYALEFVKKGQNAVMSLTEDDLGAVEFGQDLVDPMSIARMQEVEMPATVTVRYVSHQLRYQQGTRFWHRVSTDAVNSVQVDLPVAISHTKASRLTRQIMNEAWVERVRYQFSTSISTIALDPGDVIFVTAYGAQHKVRIMKVDFGTPGIIQYEGLAAAVTRLPLVDDPEIDDEDESEKNDEIYEETDDEVEPDQEVIPPDTLVPTSSTLLKMLDIPLLADADNDPGHYYAVAPSVADYTWAGAAVFRSIDGGSTYTLYDGNTTPSAIGTTTTMLADGPTTVFDEGNTVTVFMNYGTLTSKTEAEVLAGANAAAVGAHGRWEILHFKTATLVSAGTYTLSGLLRGRRGTEHAVASHAVGDTFILLSGVDRTSNEMADLNIERRYKPVTSGQNLDAAALQLFTNTGVGLKPFSPVQIAGERDLSGDLTITWVRRSRAQDYWIDGVDAPPLLPEDQDLYDLEILDGPTVVRTFSSVAVQSQVYTAAEQTTDFGSAQAAVSVRVYQISARVARGYPGSATV